MRVLVAAPLEAGSHFAHAINSVKMADGFAQLGHQVTLVCRQPPGGRVAEAELARLYGIHSGVHWIQLPTQFGRFQFDVQWGFTRSALPVLLWIRPHLVYARHFSFPWTSSLLGFPTVGETHSHPGDQNPARLQFMKGTRRRAFRLLVTISTHLARDYQTLGVPSEKILVLPDAVDLNLFTRPTLLPDRPYAGNRPVVTYAGHLYDYKGIPTILQAAQLMPEVDFHLIGGLPDDLARYATTIQRDDLHNVFLHGICPHAEVPPFLWHADVLLLVPSAHHPSAAWTSPIKLGEYLASGTPVVATSIPALRDWLTDEEVHFVGPDEPQALADGIRAVLTDQEHARQLSQMGSEKSKSLSYPKRAGRILDMAGVRN